MKPLIVLLIFLPSFASASGPQTFSCPVEQWDKEQISQLQQDQFTVSDANIDEFAVDMLGCLANKDSNIRDGVGYMAFSTWLRNNKLSEQTIKVLYEQLSSDIKIRKNDANQVYLPFAALVFSEVIRVDRVSPYLSEQELKNTVLTTADLITYVTDYRGFEDGIGWRHSLAHSSDIALQLVLNKRLKPEHHAILIKSLFQQASPMNHSFIFDESKRLATPILYSWLSNGLDLTLWQNNLDTLMNPAPFESWQDVYQSEQGLHKLHNTRLFLLELHKLVSTNDLERLNQLQPSIKAALDQLG